MYKPHGITCKIMYFHDVISQSIRQGVTKKSGVSTPSPCGEEEWSKTEVVGKMMYVPILL